MKRRLAREIALQCLYQMDMNDEVLPSAAIDMVIHEAQNDNESDLQLEGETFSTDYVKTLVEGTHRHKEEIDQLLVEYLKGWQMDRLSRVDLAVLRLAVYEMNYREDVPDKAAVNEAIELAKRFGSEESGKFINGILGQMLKKRHFTVKGETE